MVTYILILTLFAPHYEASSVIQVIPGFTTQAECLRAGQDWLDTNVGYGRPRALCVLQTKAK